jgi:hypothetical protein
MDEPERARSVRKERNIQNSISNFTCYGDVALLKKNKKKREINVGTAIFLKGLNERKASFRN